MFTLSTLYINDNRKLNLRILRYSYVVTVLMPLVRKQKGIWSVKSTAVIIL